jgi:hypothetical protein
MLVLKFHTEQRSANSKGSAREDAATEALFLVQKQHASTEHQWHATECAWMHWKFGMRPYLFVLQFHTDVLDMSHRKRRCMLGISWNRSSTSKFKETKYVSRSKLYPTLHQGTRRAWSWWRGWEVSSVRADRRNLLLHSPSFTFIHLHSSSSQFSGRVPQHRHGERGQCTQWKCNLCSLAWNQQGKRKTRLKRRRTDWQRSQRLAGSGHMHGDSTGYDRSTCSSSDMFFDIFDIFRATCRDMFRPTLQVNPLQRSPSETNPKSKLQRFGLPREKLEKKSYMLHHVAV